MIESDDKITFNPNFETQNSIINEKYIDYSNKSIKDFVNNELKAIDNSDTAEKGKIQIAKFPSWKRQTAGQKIF